MRARLTPAASAARSIPAASAARSIPAASAARSILAATAALALLGHSAPAMAGPSGNGVRAAMIYNILRFMTLPESKPRIRLCLRRGDDIAPDLAALSGEPLGAGQLEVVPVTAITDMGRACDILYLGANPSVPLAKGQISIGDSPRFIEDGGTVGLVNFGGQWRFAINARAANNGGIRISSQLMRLAARVVN
jgi:hypothetical protein